MNAMTNALKEAGMKTPTVMYRIWNWLKDHPEKTAEDVTKALGMTYSVQTQLLDMERRGMLKVYSDVSRKRGLGGVEYKIKRYSVTNTSRYELLPRVKQVVRAELPKMIIGERGVSFPEMEARKPKAKVELTEAEKFAAFLEFKQLMKDMK